MRSGRKSLDDGGDVNSAAYPHTTCWNFTIEDHRFPEESTCVRGSWVSWHSHLLGSDNTSPLSRLKHLPAALDAPLLKHMNNLLRDLLKVACGKR